MGKINVQPEIVEVKVADLNPAPYNPREISEGAYSGLKHSLEKFGYVGLIVVNKRNMRIVGGHQRYKILQEYDVESVKVIMVDLNEIEEQAMNLTLNNNEIGGEWTASLIPLIERLRKEASEDYINLRLK